MGDKLDQIDVAIIGDGYSGKLTSIFLQEEGIRSEIFGFGTGASSLWAGTIDFLKIESQNISKGLEKFQKINDIQEIIHPYNSLKSEDVNEAMLYFKKLFPDFKLNYESQTQKLANQNIITMLGTQKPCLGMWNSLSSEIEKINQEQICVLVNFTDFTGMSMNLVAKGLSEQFQGKFLVLSMSILTIIEKVSPIYYEQIKKKTLSLSLIAKFFDIINKEDSISQFREELLFTYRNSFPNLTINPITYLIFPPVMGYENPQDILDNIKNESILNCYELASLSPSIMATRLNIRMDTILSSKAISLQKSMKLIDFSETNSNKQKSWLLQFENAKKQIITILAKNIIFAPGSLFGTGPFETKETLKIICERNLIEFPKKDFQSFELGLLKNPGKSSRLFVVGSASYLFTTLSDEEEIRYGTGLGLTIISSYLVSQQLAKSAN